ncbi:hypothetical protein FACS189449_05550 [Alphaproteobacteria bacterium]|nr:hypothetical protein FACS189449_05550 [Alphaproteobacteria bacterium]
MQKDRDFVDFLKSKVSILEIISRKVKLTKTGRDWFGLCPFHSEKSGSFKVDPDTGQYYCFGCGVHGDVISFIMEFEKLTFGESLEYLANMYGIPLPQKSKDVADPKLKIYSALEVIKNWFVKELKEKSGESARKYLESRKISGEFAKKFQLGFAANSKGLLAHLQKEKFFESTLLKTGIFFKNQYKNEITNRFDGRLMFPILDASGKCVGFGGRAIEKTDAAKYINSPETEVFIKSEHLYGYSIAKRNKAKELVLAEGYLDVVSMHQAGFDGAVAPLGTSISETQIRMCWKVSDNPVISLDGDSAGTKASYRWLDKILPIACPGKSFKFARLPQEADPDSLISSGNADSLEDAIKNATTMSQWLWDGAFLLHPSETPEQKAAIIKMVREKAALIQDASIRNLYIHDIKDRERDLLYRKKFTAKGNKINIRPVITVKEKIEKIIVVTLINHPYIIDRVVEHFVGLEFNDNQMRKLKDRVLDCYNNYYMSGNIEKYASSMSELAGSIDDISKDVALHAYFSSKDVSDDEAINEWCTMCDRYSCDHVIIEDLQNAANRMESTFSDGDWQRLKALKKETLLNDVKKRR